MTWQDLISSLRMYALLLHWIITNIFLQIPYIYQLTFLINQKPNSFDCLTDNFDQFVSIYTVKISIDYYKIHKKLRNAKTFHWLFKIYTKILQSAKCKGCVIFCKILQHFVTFKRCIVFCQKFLLRNILQNELCYTE